MVAAPFLARSTCSHASVRGAASHCTPLYSYDVLCSSYETARVSQNRRPLSALRLAARTLYPADVIAGYLHPRFVSREAPTHSRALFHVHKIYFSATTYNECPTAARRRSLSHTIFWFSANSEVRRCARSDRTDSIPGAEMGLHELALDIIAGSRADALHGGCIVCVAEGEDDEQPPPAEVEAS